MRLKTLEKTTWGKIKVGEVFAVNGCWCIFYKSSDLTVLPLATTIMYNTEFTNDFDWCWLGKRDYVGIWRRAWDIYKLPLSVQKLWKEE